MRIEQFNHSEPDQNLSFLKEAICKEFERHASPNLIASMCVLTSASYAREGTVLAFSIAAAASIYYICHDPHRLKHPHDSALAEPSIIAEHTQFVNINGRRLRIVHIIHELGSKVPLLVFIHGLGGQVSQWQQQIEYFSQTAHVLAIDLLGCGKSEVVTDWSAYSTASLVDDVKALLLTRYKYPSTVIVAHSYGCAIATCVAAIPEIQKSLKALVLISPKAHIDKAQEKSQKKIRWIPDWLFECARTADRKGGLYSKSVERFMTREVSDDLRRKQLKWNLCSRTPVYKRFVYGAFFPRQETYQKIKVGVLMIGGSEDKVTLPTDMNVIRNYLLGLDPLETQWDTAEPSENARVPEPYVIPNVGHMPMVVRPELVNPFISEFLIKNCNLYTLSGAWQVVHKTKGENKWDLKNYEKWTRTAAITLTPIGPSLFRAMKVMRQTDAGHCPSAFLAKYPEIGFIIDISNDTPPYRSSDFEHSRIQYIKLRTVSKIPPSKDDVAKFIKTAASCWEKSPDAQIAVHCHYGFNRTGFFICCYMIEKLGVPVPDAIRYFAEARAPGIR
ncbi:hypothetical protein EC973_006559 [Apophysomyces ossiformis]|uniref:Tyrosine specific protein phosphatases domain-containing protein n=1 Tax=Apophysomyces ossiformis TaxID=679940 RepID=A0A8H7EUJ0_9FUNG|nr:hypothetical protein EC973_006559 [Apophysomyces ossiformis]